MNVSKKKPENSFEAVSRTGKPPAPLESEIQKAFVELTVYGIPRPQGSMRSFVNPRTQKVVSLSQIKGLKPWRQEIAGAAMALRAAMIPKHQSVCMELHFFFERPPSVSIRKRPHMTVAPDLDKLQRAVFDALKGILYADDAQIVIVEAHKHYGSPERVEISVGSLES